MAQHDYVIANGTGAAVRSDLNNALAAIVSQNSGASAPATTYAYQWWADTSTNLLKLRNGANSSFITVGDLTATNLGLAALASPTFTGTVTIPTATISTGAGIPLASAASPAIYFTGDTNTGIYSPGADQFAITTGGSGRVFVDSSGRVGLGTSSPSAALHVATSGAGQIRYFDGTVTGAFGSFGSGNEVFLGSGKALAFTTNGITSSETRMTIDTSGRVGIGSTVPTSTLSLGGNMDFQQSSNLSTTTGYLNIEPQSFLYVGGGSGAGVVLRIAGSEKARLDSSGRFLVGTSSAASAAGTWATIAKLAISGSSASSTDAGIINLRPGNDPTASATALGVITFTNNTGNEFATIEARIDGTAGSGGSGDYPGRLTFSTTADGASSPTERMRIASGGRVSAPSWYDETTAVAANVNVASTGILQRSTSSIKYKTNVETIEDSYSDALLNCRPVWYRSTCANDNPNYGWWGFIAEEVAEIDPRLCLFEQKEDGNLEPEGVAYDRFVPHLLNLIKRQGEAIAELQAEVAALKGA